MHTDTSRVMSLSNPEKKMSKTSPNGCLFLSDPPSVVRKKILSAQTDSHREIGFDPKKRPGISSLLSIYSGISGKPISHLVKEFKKVGYAEFKKSLAEEVVGFLAPIQKRRAELLRDKKAVMKILGSGARKAIPIANEKLAEAKRRAGLI